MCSSGDCYTIIAGFTFIRRGSSFASARGFVAGNFRQLNHAVLVTGGAGYIGSVVVEELVRDGHEVVVYDSLYKGHRGAVVEGARLVEADLLDGERLQRAFREQGTEAVIHMAADSLVGESVVNPSKYYRNNVVAGLALLDAMKECEVRRLVFSSTAATYGEPEKQPVKSLTRRTDQHYG